MTSAGTIAYTQESEDEEEIFELSPFEVTTSDNDIGYRQQNTLAGTRLNTNVGDLASSITVVTKQQLEDTAAVDINDVFLYEANTEGANNYTAYHINRGYVKDEISGISRDSGDVLSASTSNRIRGLSAADTSQNNYPSIARLKFDTYNTQSVEINRGPNSMLFGMGSPSGIVNQSTASAVLDVENTSVSFRFGSYGSWRASFNHNQPIIDNKLAIYVAALRDETNFRRKPSYDDQSRQYAAITYKPFENTSLRGSVENIKNDTRRPNTLAPRDAITPWMQAGRPVWDVKTGMVEYLDTGAMAGPYLYNADADVEFTGTPLTQSNPNYGNGSVFFNDNDLWNEGSPLFVGVLGPMSTSSTMHIDPDGNVTGFWDWNTGINRPAEPAEGTPENAAYWSIRNRRLMQTIVPWIPEYGGSPRVDNVAVNNPWYPVGLTDESVYDWSRINITAPNYQELKGQTYNLEFEQKLAENLYLQLGWFKQDVDSLENNPIANTSPTTVQIDVNKYLLDGSDNPDYLKPYIDDYRADVFTNPETNENYRAMLAYSYDFTQTDNWTKWFGKHQASALWTRNETNRYRTRSRIAFFDDSGRGIWTPNPIPDNYSLAEKRSAIRRYYYLGENAMVTEGNVGVGGFGDGYGTGTNGNLALRSWYNDSATAGHWEQTDVTVGTALWWPGTSRNYRKVDSQSIAIQSKFWENRIVTTLGWRKDDYFAESYGGGRDDAGYENGVPINPEYYFTNKLGDESLDGTTSTRGIVFKPLKWISLTYNDSDNFNPPNGNRTDFFENPLPKPTGKGKDYGVRFNLFENKLVASLNWFENSDENARGVPSVFIDRTMRIDYTFFKAWADRVVRIRSGEDPSEQDFGNAELRPLTTTQEQQIADIVGLPYDWPNGVSVDATQSREAEGLEFQLIYNPLPNWTMKLTGGRQSTIVSNIAPQWEPWVEQRMAVWQAAAAPDLQDTYYTFNQDPETETPNLKIGTFWDAYGYNSNIKKDSTNGWTTTENYYNPVVRDEVASIRSQEGLKSPGQREWRANFLTNYKFTDGKFKGLAVGGAARWEEAAAIGNYGIGYGTGSQLTQGDPSNPIFSEAEFHLDLWASYAFDLTDNIDMKIQLNVRDALEDGGLQEVAANYDGTVYGYRFVDPRQWYLTTTFEF